MTEFKPHYCKGTTKAKSLDINYSYCPYCAEKLTPKYEDGFYLVRGIECNEKVIVKFCDNLWLFTGDEESYEMKDMLKEFIVIKKLNVGKL